MAKGKVAAPDFIPDDAPDFIPDEPPPIAGLSSSDAGPSARRAAAGLSPGPRMLSDEEAGVGSLPIKVGFTKGAGPLPSIVPYSAEEFGRRDAAMTPAERRAAHAESDANAAFLVSMIPAAGAGRVAGELTGVTAPRLLPGAVAPTVTPVLSSAAEGAVGAKVMGADPRTGALLGGGFGAIDPAINLAAKGAPARVAERSVRNLTEDVTQKTANKVTAKAGPEGLGLKEVVDRNPELKKTLAVQAKDNPGAALKTVKSTKAAANASRDADFDKMQAHYEDKPASSQATISGLLDDVDKLIDKSPADLGRQDVLARARDEYMKLGDRLRKRQGLPPANGDYSGTVISPNDLRDLEKTIGERAYEGIPIDKRLTVKRRVNNELYAPIAKQLQGLAENTPGVDARAFADTGKDISTLIPVEEALQYRVDRAAQGKKPFTEKLANVAHGAVALGAGITHGIAGLGAGVALPLAAKGAMKLGGRALRGIDYRLAETAPAGKLGVVPDVTPLVVPAAAASDRGYARSVLDDMNNGMSLEDAVGAH